MAKSTLKFRPAGSLKDAQARLVQACGGTIRAATLVRVSKSQLHKYTDADEPNETVHMPVDVVRVLELACREPHVTRFLAAEASCVLEPVATDGDAADQVAARTAEVAARAAHLFSDASEALADGVVDADEARRIIADCDETTTATAELRRAARGVVDGATDA